MIYSVALPLFTRNISWAHGPIHFHYKFQTFSFTFGLLFQDSYTIFYFERLLPGPMDILNPGRRMNGNL